MTAKIDFNDNKPIDNNTMELISERVAEYKKNKQTSKDSSEELDVHIDALSEVFDLDKRDIEHIAKDVLTQQEQRASFKDKLYDGVIKYSKEVIISIVVVMVVSFLLLGRSSLQQPNPSSTQTAEGASPNFSHFRKKTNLVNVLVAITPIKVMLMEFYADKGDYPETLEQIGLDRNEMKTGKGINDLILEKGSIIVKLDESVGDNIILVLSPEVTMGGMRTEWQCKTNFSGNLGNCKKVKGNQYLAKFQ